MDEDLGFLEMRQATLNKESTRSRMSTPSNDLTKVFNNAVVSSRAEELSKNSATELAQLLESPAFQAIILAAQSLALEQGTTEKQAAEQIIQTFRKIDRIWGSYLYLEGMSAIFKN